MAVIKNKKTGMWEVRTYYKDLTEKGSRRQRGTLLRKAKPSNGNGTSN